MIDIKKTSERLDQLIAAGLVALIVFSALAHGAIEPWSLAVVCWMIIALIGLWGIKNFVDREFVLQVPTTFWPFAGLILLALIQSLAFSSDDGIRKSLSLDVEATRKALLLLCLFAAVFLMAVNFLVKRERLEKLSWFLSSYGLAMAVFALLQHFTWNGRFYWMRPMGDLVSPFGPFINHNLYAGHMEMLVFIPAGIAMAGRVRGAARLFLVFAAFVMSLSVILSLSRGGTISLAAGLLFLVVMSGIVRYSVPELELGLRERARSLLFSTRTALIAVAIMGVIGLGLIWLGPEPVINRMTQGQLAGSDQQSQTFFSSRGWIWQDTLQMFRANPVYGVGLGAYETAYPVYTSGNGMYKVSEAHNDYLQILADAGIIGGILALCFLFTLMRAILRSLWIRDRLMGAFALGSGAGLVSMLTHSFFDFNLQIPSNALLFLFLSGVSSQLSTVAVRQNVAAEVIYVGEENAAADISEVVPS